MENQRIKAIKDAAALLFIKQGYAKTQISHIANSVGVSVGTIYHDFTGKQEIMHFVLKCTIDPDFANREFERPITDDLFHGLNEEIALVFEKSASGFSKHLDDKAKSYTFEELISDTFDLLSQYAAGCLFIEKNQFDFKTLASSYKEYRKKFFQAMTGYLLWFIEKGVIRPLENVELTTTLIIEMLTWWAMDLRYISFDDAVKHIPIEQAKKVCLDNLTAAYKL